MARSQLYKLLMIPWVYNVAQHVFAPGHASLQRRAFRTVPFATAGPILDVGCGPGLKTPEPTGVVVGIDLNPDCLRDYTGGWIDTDIALVGRPPAGRARLDYRCSADDLPFPDGTFAEARCRSMLHHVPGPVAARAIREMIRCVWPGGSIILIDPVWPRVAWRRPLAWLIQRLDRGEWVHTEDELVALAREAAPGSWACQRYLLSYHGTEGLVLVWKKPAESAARRVA